MTAPTRTPWLANNIGTVVAVVAALFMAAAIPLALGWFNSPPPDAAPLTGEKEIAAAIKGAGLLVFWGLVAVAGSSR